MATELETYRRVLDELYAQMDEVLDGLTPEALVWRPFESSPWKGPSGQLGWIIAHGLSSTVYLLRLAEYCAGKREYSSVEGDRGRDEFTAADHEPTKLRERARVSRALAHDILAGFTPVELDAERPHPKRPERIFTARHSIVHALEHLSQHIGHAQLTRQLWALRQA
ncbi:MAG: DinB family protein [Anaerolineae bacterium]|nr:DinB family protein [Thermoflexales bacterium]MDW8406664.1 DinB family protein [Anaerolineae bacterium]